MGPRGAGRLHQNLDLVIVIRDQDCGRATFVGQEHESRSEVVAVATDCLRMVQDHPEVSDLAWARLAVVGDGRSEFPVSLPMPAAAASVAVMEGRDLHSLLGLAPGTTSAELRAAYERAIADAARSHNIRRAAVLSAAFDRLPASTRSGLYSSRGFSAPSRARQSLARTPPARTVRHRRYRSGRWRIALATICGLLLLAALGRVAFHFGSGLGWHLGTRTPQAPTVATALSPGARPPISAAQAAYGIPGAFLDKAGFREYLPPGGALIDFDGATMAQCVYNTASLIPTWSRVKSGTILVCSPGQFAIFKVAG